MLAPLISLLGCEPDECSVPRTGDEEVCDVYEGDQLRFIVGDPLPDIRAFCSSPCVDIKAPLAIAGYDDLRRVPLLPKVRQVYSLGINVDMLRDLKGLERVDIVRSLELSGQGASTGSKTLTGLTDQEMDSFFLDRVAGLESLEGASLRKLNSFAASRSSIKTLDLSELSTVSVSVDDNEALESLALGASKLEFLSIHANPALTTLSSGPGLTVRNTLFVDSNSSLSSCRVQELVDQTKVGPRTEVIRNNGPCP